MSKCHGDGIEECPFGSECPFADRAVVAAAHPRPVGWGAVEIELRNRPQISETTTLISLGISGSPSIAVKDPNVEATAYVMAITPGITEGSVRRAGEIHVVLYGQWQALASEKKIHPNVFLHLVEA